VLLHLHLLLVELYKVVVRELGVQSTKWQAMMLYEAVVCELGIQRGCNGLMRGLLVQLVQVEL